MARSLAWLAQLVAVVMLSNNISCGADPPGTSDEQLPDAGNAGDLKVAAERSIVLLQAASAGSAERRTCFTCHSQAHPVLAIVEAKRRGLSIDEANLANQLNHTAEHHTRGRQDYLAGRGQGGKSDTAGYALWTLSSGSMNAPEVTAPVVHWLLSQQLQRGNWNRSSDRPPSEASHFTTTFVALKGITDYAQANRSEPADNANDNAAAKADAIRRAREWLLATTAADTEDRVFRLLSLHLVGALDTQLTAAAKELRDGQREDGGWAQTDDMTSDAYATGTAMFALHFTQRLAADARAYQQGLDYLLKSQQADGSWHVRSRSRPFQAYYETGFPHGKDQFISTSATAWATLAILLALPEKPSLAEEFSQRRNHFSGAFAMNLMADAGQANAMVVSQSVTCESQVGWAEGSTGLQTGLHDGTEILPELRRK